MQGARWAAALIAAMGLLFASAASAASADLMYTGGAIGVMVPWEGDTGYTAMGEIGTDWTNAHVRVGGEFAFAKMDRDVTLTTGPYLGPTNVGVRTWELRFVTRYMMFPGKISPYLGCGGGLMIVEVDDGLAATSPTLNRGTSKAGLSGGVLGLLGLEIPLFSKNLNLFAEARANYSWEISNNLPPLVESKNYNGFSGLGGLRARF